MARRLALRCAVTFVEMLHACEEARTPPGATDLTIVTLNKGQLYGSARILRGLAGPIPMTVLNCWSPRLASELGHLLQSCKFDTVQIENVHLMEYLPVIRDAPGHPAIIVDWHNIESELMWRYAKTTSNWLKKLVAIRTAKLLERAENRLLDASCTHTVTSERERKKLLARRPTADIRVIPNGIDVSYYTSNRDARGHLGAGDRKAIRTILFVGSMDYHANIDAVTWFARTSWREIAQKYPDLQFTIVGRDPAPEVLALASDRIQVTGTVDDVRPFYASALAVVVPLRSGSGTRLKILEAMAAGVPVVSTRLGAEGIDAENKIHLLLADTALEIAAAVGLVVTSAETRATLSAAARTLVTARYDWSIMGEQLYRIHCELVRSRQEPAFAAIGSHS